MKTASLLVPCFLILLSCQDVFAKQGFFWYKGDESNYDDTFYKMLHCLANNGKDCLKTRDDDIRHVPEISDALKHIQPNLDKGHITGVKFPTIGKVGSAPIIKEMFEELKRQFKEYLGKIEKIPELKQKLEAEVVQRHAGATLNDVQEIVKGIVESHFLVDLLEPWLNILTNYLNHIRDEIMVGVKRWKAVDAVKTSFEKVEQNYDAENFNWPDTNFGWLGEADSTATVVSG